MSRAEIDRLQADAKTNEELKKALTEAGNDVDKVVAVATSKGYDFTADELKAAIEAAKGDKELGEEDLDKVAGGAVLSVFAGVVI